MFCGDSMICGASPRRASEGNPPLRKAMNFLENIFAQLDAAESTPVLQELRENQSAPVTGRELLTRVGQARAFLAARRLKQGDRCALLAANSIAWIALDLAIMADGLIVVPLYARQAPAEL